MSYPNLNTFSATQSGGSFDFEFGYHHPECMEEETGHASEAVCREKTI